MFDLSPFAYIAPAVVTGLLTAVASWVAAQRTARSNEQLAKIKRDDELRRERAEARESHAEDLTNRFKIIMDGYEHRIQDLVGEVERLRLEIAQLRAEQAARSRACAGCPYFRSHSESDYDGTD